MQETAPTASERTSKTDYESKGIYYSNNQPQTQLKQNSSLKNHQTSWNLFELQLERITLNMIVQDRSFTSKSEYRNHLTI